MEKKLYHIIDPETGEMIEKRYIGGLGKLLYQMVATGWSKRLRWAFRIAIFLCIVLAVAEPVLRERFPTFYDRAEGVLFLAVLVVGGRIFSFVLTFSKRKHKKEEKLYHIVDPETGEVVDTLRPKDVKKQVDMASPADRFEFAMSCVFVACLLLAVLSAVSMLFIPDDWRLRVGIAIMIFSVLMWFSELIRRYNPYNQKNKDANKFERMMTYLTFACFFLAVLFGLALFFIPDGWSLRVVTLAWLFAILSAISASVWRHEKENRENDNGEDK